VIYQNELYRFGGQNSLRGFNEDELFASARSVITLEYRFLLDRNSNVFVFYDQAYSENSAIKYSKDQPFGFGTGLSFGTNLGIFSVSYALGSQMQNPILLKNGKIHFGYIAYF
jgi:hemolysin activation/secretion protein